MIKEPSKAYKIKKSQIDYPSSNDITPKSELDIFNHNLDSRRHSSNVE